MTAGNVVVASGIVRCNTLSEWNFTTTASYTINAALGQVWRLTHSGDAAGSTITLSASNLAIGQVVYVIFINNNATNAITLGDNEATVKFGITDLSIAAGTTYTASFVSDGSCLYMLSRTQAGP